MNKSKVPLFQTCVFAVLQTSEWFGSASCNIMGLLCCVHMCREGHDKDIKYSLNLWTFGRSISVHINSLS